MAAPTRWGIASSGKISHDFSNALSIYPDKHKVVAVAARSLDRAQEFANGFGIKTAHGSYEALAADPDVEVVYIGSINTEHVKLCKMMFAAGKHVLCEKPLGLNVRETKEIVDSAKKNKVFMMEAIWSRFIPSYVKVREDIAKGVIGDVLHSEALFAVPIDKVDRIMKKEMGGGSVLDIGIYCVNWAQFVHGSKKPKRVVANGHLFPTGTDSCMGAVITYEDGGIATVATNTHVKVLSAKAQVHGTKGSITMHFPFWCANKMTTPEGDFEFDVPKAKLDFNFDNSAYLANEAHHVRECLERGLTESPIIPMDESIMIAEILETIRKQIGADFPQDAI